MQDATPNLPISDYLRVALKMAKDLGFDLNGNTRIMDFGCGSGRVVQELRSLGYPAFGCDLEFRREPEAQTESMHHDGVIRLINKNAYVLPFENDSLDLVISNQVFEHVQDYLTASSELARVLKPEGMCVHIFPARYSPIEPHSYVPLSSVIQSYWWLYLWALLGVRNEHQKNASAKETATENCTYLKTRTNYLSKRRIAEAFFSRFRDVTFCENLFLKHAPRGKYLHAISKLLPFVPSVYSAFRCRVVVVKNPIKTATLESPLPLDKSSETRPGHSHGLGVVCSPRL
jgi:SAM-dependent methyltransferase